ncbi:MAG: hypothetical protein HYV07_05075 [Deltaproteobacteria bacterium]|nr:hypothetical protein [Deltaproteobacteria bacterium]
MTREGEHQIPEDVRSPPNLPIAALALGLASACSEEIVTVPFQLHETVASIGPDPLAGTGQTSCPVYEAEACEAGEKRRCAVFDTTSKSFVDQPDPLLRRVFLYDRWYDLYTSPLGLTMERLFDGPMPGSAPEADWVSHFAGWAGAGDAAIWTGVALVSDFFRYTQTRTEADYQRMEAKTRALVRNFEVTGAPGYLARYHWLLVPEGTPQSDQLILERGEASLGDVSMPLPSVDIEGLPDEYKNGVPDGQGGLVPPRPYWDGDPSIDQYTGPMVAFPLVYPHLRDDALKAKLVQHLTCYLKRLERIEIRNLRSRPDLIAELQEAFGGSGLKLDPGDPNPAQLDTMVWYVLPGINSKNYAGYDRACPAHVQLEASRVYDALSPTFESELLGLAQDINRSTRTRQTQIDHFYIPSIRGGDASHLMHLAAVAYHLTKDDEYLSFLFEELIGKIQADKVALTMMAFRAPDACFKFYGDHITYGTHWQFLTMLEESPLRTTMLKVMEEEIWQKAMWNHHNAKADVLYASTVPPTASHDDAVRSLAAQLTSFGGNGGVDEAPRRTHNRTAQSIIDRLPEGITVRCPTETERVQCETETTLLGFPLESKQITYECDGRPGECRFEDGKCTEGLASEGLPTPLRAYADFLWQRSPFNLGDAFSVDGQKQSPGRDLGEPFWMARSYGFVGQGRDQVLAWKPSGSCE